MRNTLLLHRDFVPFPVFFCYSQAQAKPTFSLLKDTFLLNRKKSIAFLLYIFSVFSISTTITDRFRILMTPSHAPDIKIGKLLSITTLLRHILGIPEGLKAKTGKSYYSYYLRLEQIQKTKIFSATTGSDLLYS